MTNRPCKPDADLQGIWQMLLPDLSFPKCGVPNAGHAIGSNSTTSTNQQVNCHNEHAAAGTPRLPDELT